MDAAKSKLPVLLLMMQLILSRPVEMGHHFSSSALDYIVIVVLTVALPH